MTYDVGYPGRLGDAGVFRSLELKVRFVIMSLVFYIKKFYRGFWIPTTVDLHQLGIIGPVQYHILVNGGFGQGQAY
ncbi:unnamed protein product [Cylicostephanus goldi]|uniref:Uncharacterized protein n=1 Tax=Cylicostephanus goldi TaxID=71465 RepID=A0A3P7N5U0_CYLGO|nr:unnamed protein product [Cylicostephanus goldi]